MTGVSGNPRAFMPGVRCIIHQLRRHNSRVPLVVAASDESYAHVTTDLSSRGLLGANVSLLRWGRFPVDASIYRVKYGWRWSGSRVLDKLNVLGAPYRRVVWLDADVHIQRNVDELCDALPDATRRLAAAFNSGHEPRTCWQPGKNPAADECRGCRHHGVTKDEREGGYWVRTGLAEQDAGKRRGLKRCVYEVNSGVLVVAPHNQSAFRSEVVAPVACGRVVSRDGSDQGALNSLVHGHGALGGRPAPLHPSYNAVMRNAMTRPSAWRRWNPAIVHLVGPRKPWSAAAPKDALAKPHDPYLLEERRWLKSCKQFAPDTSSNRRTARLQARADPG